MSEYALMCPQCQSIVGGGEYDESHADEQREIEAIATQAGLTVLRMCSNLAPQNEKCTCPTPSPSSRFLVLMQLSHWIVEDANTGKPLDKTPGLKDVTVPTLNGKGITTEAEGRAEVERFTAEIEKLSGIKVKIANIYEEPSPATLPRNTRDKEKAEYTFRTDGLDAKFIVTRYRKGWKKIEVRIIESEHGYQLWPANPADVLVLDRNTIDRDKLVKEVVIPFLQRIAGYPQEKYDAWINGNLALKENPS